MAIGLIIASIAGLGLSGSVMNSENKQAEAQQEPQQRQTPTIEIPVSKGYVDGKVAYFIATDASDRQAVESIKNNTGHPINFAPILVQTPQSECGQGYLFLMVSSSRSQMRYPETKTTVRYGNRISEHGMIMLLQGN